LATNLVDEKCSRSLEAQMFKYEVKRGGKTATFGGSGA